MKTKKLSKLSKLSNCIICNKNIAEMCGECMLKSQLEVGNKRYKKAIDDFVEKCHTKILDDTMSYGEIVLFGSIVEVAKELGGTKNG
jgi:hypothetical protein